MNRLSHQQIARDIDWLLSSPSIINPNCDSRFICPATHPVHHYQITGSGYSELVDILHQRRSHLLGIYYESLWQYILRHSKEHQLIACNLQVQNNHKTLGEYDLILKSLRKQVFIHRELAVKFYLGLPSSTRSASPWNHWIGPGLRDRMDRKLNHMLTHQITLSETLAGQVALNALDITEVTTEILFQGYLFYPITGICPIPEDSAADHLCGHWLPINQLSAWLDREANEACYLPMPKSLWLSSYRGLPDPSIHLSKETLIQRMQSQLYKSARPQLVIRCHEQDGEIKENCRFFVVPDDWEAKALMAAEI
ncbi:DUF1853 family protein [Endozoicomonas numazuensis]|uniref:DUF1853 domain-containing protein n=1 Tax=Endozoicomonas numazuensis TaxID=1137799 RepID=A0A081NDZ6_9GAMM|nr:DUF1853 family protein [Endozoicomonas numazuensis]KEQ16669.1 hypothetical protein GZ78_18305 [Endozoicomonas numazuensis]